MMRVHFLQLFRSCTCLKHRRLPLILFDPQTIVSLCRFGGLFLCHDLKPFQSLLTPLFCGSFLLKAKV